MKLVFATNNKHKLDEMRAILGDKVELLSLADIDCHDDIPETADTLEGNALIKARHIYSKYGCSCFADDTGLEVDALGGEPGVYSARYAGESNDSEANMRKLLDNLTGKTDRNAQFRTVIALIINGEEKLFDGVVRGAIAEQRMGTAGFGYDPIFVPEGFAESFAQMPAEQKNSMSHRARAAAALNEYLQTL
ncbi:MAG: non-canonical purine NTP diphosphatase [Bacteroidaceae bacterium]|nr:non-canonical purine NTP diphosphatase [Bacteroidaceae bacterium]MBR5276455.1 non-canonical purine NTP diphosphatase [Bacteroidaceae bacterium]